MIFLSTISEMFVEIDLVFFKYISYKHKFIFYKILFDFNERKKHPVWAPIYSIATYMDRKTIAINTPRVTIICVKNIVQIVSIVSKSIIPNPNNYILL